MSECGRLSDRMPAVALGQSPWTAEEASHLAHCGACREEWDLVRVTAGLGMAVGGELDPAAMRRTVLQRLAGAEKTVRRRRSWSFAALSGAAAAAAIVWASRTDSVRPPSPLPAPAVASLQIQLPELDDLQPAELNAVLQTMDEPYIGDPDNGVASDPGDEDLENGFETWEG